MSYPAPGTGARTEAVLSGIWAVRAGAPVSRIWPLGAESVSLLRRMFSLNTGRPGGGIKIHTFLAFLFVILPNKHRPSFMGTFVIAIHRVARNIYGPALPCTFVINKTPGGQF